MLSHLLRSQGEHARWESVAALLLAAACLMALSSVHRFTRKKAGYSQSFVHSLLLMGLVTTLIMLVVGSNLARAFSLVGALSIIRFRNSVNQAGDLGFVVGAIAMGICCGTSHYFLAILGTLVLSLVMVIAHLTNFAPNPLPPERLLTVKLPAGDDPDALVAPVLPTVLQSWLLVTLERTGDGTTSATYSVRELPGTEPTKVLEALAKSNLKAAFTRSP